MAQNHDPLNEVSSSMPEKHAGHALQFGTVMIVNEDYAGMQYAIDLADSGFAVYLFKKTPTTSAMISLSDTAFPPECTFHE